MKTATQLSRSTETLVTVENKLKMRRSSTFSHWRKNFFLFQSWYGVPSPFADAYSADNVSQVVNFKAINRHIWHRDFFLFFSYESRAIAVKIARCHCELRYTSKFTAASRGSPCAIAQFSCYFGHRPESSPFVAKCMPRLWSPIYYGRPAFRYNRRRASTTSRQWVDYFGTMRLHFWTQPNYCRKLKLI